MTRATISLFSQAKAAGERIAMITAYDATMAQLVDEAGVDTILVGDSLGMTMLGYDSTVDVTLDDMVHHTKAVVRGSKRALVVADLPFLSYHVSTAETVRNAGRLVQQGGATAVKLEGGRPILDHVRAIVNAQIPVVGHLGLTPQSVNVLGGYKVQGRDAAAARTLLDDALALQDAGVCAIVLECVPAGVARIVTEKLSIPTIGIGAGVGCDGQVLVVQDMLGMFDRLAPRFVKRYAELGTAIKEAVAAYAAQVRDGSFPEDSHSFSTDPQVIESLY